MGQLLDSGTWHQQQLIQLAAFLTPHTQWFNSQLELTVSSQEYLKELRILLFQRALYKLTSRDVLKKGNYYFFLYNNYICFKSLYTHDKVLCYSAGFSYSVLMWPRFAVGGEVRYRSVSSPKNRSGSGEGDSAGTFLLQEVYSTKHYTKTLTPYYHRIDDLLE